MSLEASSILDRHSELVQKSKVKLGSISHELSMMSLGIAGEAGEVLEPIKKHLYHGKDLDLEKMKLELGDLLWYIHGLTTLLGFTLEEVIESNITKIEDRYLSR